MIDHSKPITPENKSAPDRSSSLVAKSSTASDPKQGLCSTIALLALARAKQGTEVIQQLSAMPEGDLVNTLTENSFIWNLAFNGLAGETISLLKKMTRDHQAKVLNGAGAMEALLKCGQVSALLEIVKGLDHEQKASLLAKPFVITRYFATTKELAEQTFDTISDLPHEQQTVVLAVDNVVKVLADHGLALDVFDIMSALSPYQQATIRVAKGVDLILSYACRRASKRQPPRRKRSPEDAVTTNDVET